MIHPKKSGSRSALTDGSCAIPSSPGPHFICLLSPVTLSLPWGRQAFVMKCLHWDCLRGGEKAKPSLAWLYDYSLRFVEGCHVPSLHPSLLLSIFLFTSFLSLSHAHYPCLSQSSSTHHFIRTGKRNEHATKDRENTLPFREHFVLWSPEVYISDLIFSVRILMQLLILCVTTSYIFFS